MSVVRSENYGSSGTIVLRLHLGPEWPVLQGMRIVELSQERATVLVTAETNGRLRVRLNDTSAGVERTIESPPLELVGSSDIPFWLEWDWSTILSRFRLYDSIWFSPGDHHEKIFPVPARQSSAAEVVVVSD